MSTIAAILTDFGNDDNYAGILKGVLLGMNKKIIPVDLCNDIDACNVTSASFLLYSGFDYFPKGTVFLVVVDPGVGSERNEICGIIDGKYIICPDNGIVTLLVRMNSAGDFYKINRDEIFKYTKCTAGSTFHGRDIFAPACGIISKSRFKKICAEKIEPVLTKDFDVISKSGKITGRVVHIDHYGNCITSIHRDDAKSLRSSNSVKINMTKITGISGYFREAGKGRALAYWGSSGFLEIAVNESNASRILKIRQHDSVELS